MADPMFLVVQKGGSSGEWYASTYESRADAEQAIKGHKAATYGAIGPYEIPAALAAALAAHPDAEGALAELIDEVAGDVGFEDFSDLEPDEEEEDEDDFGPCPEPGCDGRMNGGGYCSKPNCIAAFHGDEEVP